MTRETENVVCLLVINILFSSSSLHHSSFICSHHQSSVLIIIHHCHYSAFKVGMFFYLVINSWTGNVIIYLIYANMIGVCHYKIRGIIYSRSEIQSPVRHGHQLIFLMKVELFWCSWMKNYTLWIRLWSQCTVGLDVQRVISGQKPS